MHSTDPVSSIAHLSLPWSIGWVALSFLVCLFVRLSSRYVDIRLNLHFFNIYRHRSPILTQYHLIPSSTKLYWPSTQSTNQYCPILTKYHQILTSTVFYCPIIIMYQPVLLHTDPVLSYINPHCPILTKYHQVPTSTTQCQNKKCQTFLCRPEMSTVVR